MYIKTLFDNINGAVTYLNCCRAVKIIARTIASTSIRLLHCV